MRRLFGFVLGSVGMMFIFGACISLAGNNMPSTIVFGAVGGGLLVLGWRWTGSRYASWREDPASERQKEFAREFGIRFHEGITKGELSDLISEVTGK